MKPGRISRLRPSLNSRALSNQSSEGKTDEHSPSKVPKIRGHSSDDFFEKQADQVADAVVQRREIPRINSTMYAAQAKGEEEEAQTKKETLQTKGEEEEAQVKAEEQDSMPKGEEEEEAQAKSQHGQSSGYLSGGIAKKIQTHKGQGAPLQKNIRAFMETGFQNDFSRVRIHTGNEAVTLSKELKAQAFTVGNDIFFNSSKYKPKTKEGKNLLAHELTHTIQQRGGTRKR